MSAEIIGTGKEQTSTLIGTVDKVKNLTGLLFQEAQLVGSLATAYSAGVSNYEGEYEVTPSVTAQTLPTKDKLMSDDLTIKAIPVYNVGNTSGGSTFYIATMDEA